jgi:peptide-methionine (S)-S-oxide reductase
MEAAMSGDLAVHYAHLAGGCFWCLEAVYEGLPGVIGVVSGYSGGSQANPTYEDICSGRSGHIETVRIAFDPAKVSYAGLLELFWKIHDPTTRDRQGADVGSQYRSVIFYLSEEQKAVAEDSIRNVQARFSAPIETEIRAAPVFWKAEEYHQGYYRKNPEAGYCRIVIAPKVAKASLG